jgi:hypothetical protein
VEAVAAEVAEAEGAVEGLYLHLLACLLNYLLYCGRLLGCDANLV